MVSVLLACGVWLQIATQRGGLCPPPMWLGDLLRSCCSGYRLVIIGIITVAWIVTPVVEQLPRCSIAQLSAGFWIKAIH